MTIQLLSPILINQIAAGEVVDRPASIVKELVENAIDAGATEISIQLEHGGRDVISVSDNGCGIQGTELHLAVAPHATSKIMEEADLAAVASLGFRGEALASIGSVSHLAITSRTKEDDAGMRIEVDGGEASEPAPTAARVGTTVEVKRLFYNTPARRKFLKSDSAETTRVRDAVQKIAAAHPLVSFVLKSGDRTLLRYGQSDTKDRLISIFGPELTSELIDVSYELGEMKLWGVIGTPDVARPTSRNIRVHVNGRTIQDPSITHALKDAFKGLIEPNRWPTAALFIEMNPALVDVNVHPQKSEVRFRDKNAIWRLVNRGVATALQANDIVATFWPSDSSTSSSFGTGEQLPMIEGVSTEWMHQETPLPTIRKSDEVMQVHKCFLVTQDEQGILIIDQHALHERIMFEELYERMQQTQLESQRLLVPDSIEADGAKMELFEEHQVLFQKLGIEVEASGPASISVYALPTLLVSRSVEGSKFIQDVFDLLSDAQGEVDEETVLVDILDMMACKAAIKAGDEMTQTELKDLLSKRHLYERSSRCPHGRPTTMRLSIEELEKKFGRR